MVERMRDAWATASRYEWTFWDAAWRQEIWPV
jgi:thiaminase/transcriptional activator TenA